MENSIHNPRNAKAQQGTRGALALRKENGAGTPRTPEEAAAKFAQKAAAAGIRLGGPAPSGGHPAAGAGTAAGDAIAPSVASVTATATVNTDSAASGTGTGTGTATTATTTTTTPAITAFNTNKAGGEDYIRVLSFSKEKFLRECGRIVGGGTKTETETQTETKTEPIISFGRDEGGSNDGSNDDGGSNHDVGTMTKTTAPGCDCGNNDDSSGNDDNDVDDDVAYADNDEDDDAADDRGDNLKFW
ncbi:hypothetical protein GGR56DRAFT_678227 [Xylariaceae sp. FL0804]|nr:hypothetical protein GGR56DRAFT_678227 [Xylariaceae sp. FL0804]